MSRRPWPAPLVLLLPAAIGAGAPWYLLVVAPGRIVSHGE